MIGSWCEIELLATNEETSVGFFVWKGGDSLKKLVERCSRVTEYAEFAVESIITQFLARIANELSAGFSVQLRTGHLAENYP